MIPDTGGTIFCEIEDDNYQWISYFKGALFAYEKATNEHYVVYVPEHSYVYINSMVLGERYLWLNLINKKGVFVFDKKRKVFDLVPFDEPLNEDDVIFYEYWGLMGTLSGYIWAENSKLYLRGHGEWELEEINLKYPSFIDPTTEFKDPENCM